MPKTSLKILIFCLLAVGCAKEKSSESVREAGVKSESITGSLVENVNSVQADEFRTACEDKFRDVQLELAKALDAKAGEIDRFVRARGDTSSANFRRVQLGPITARERINSSIPRAGWQSFRNSWSEAWADYQKLRNLPVNADWMQLNMDVRSLILNDVNRVVNGQNFYLDHNSSYGVEMLAGALDACVQNADCSEAPNSGYLQKFIESQPIYFAYRKLIGEKNAFSEKRRLLQRFQRLVNSDFRRFGFRTNPRMDRVDPGKYELFVDVGPFADVAGQVAAYVESVWRAPGNQVRVRWKNRLDYPELFQLASGTTAGERSYVDWTERQVMLFPDVRVNSIAHEFGHVMGFPDRYYEVWDPSSCSYETQYSADDIMSDSTAGVVLPSHWQDLASHYH